MGRALSAPVTIIELVGTGVKLLGDQIQKINGPIGKFVSALGQIFRPFDNIIKLFSEGTDTFKAYRSIDQDKMGGLTKGREEVSGGFINSISGMLGLNDTEKVEQMGGASKEGQENGGCSFKCVISRQDRGINEKR